MPAKEKKPHAEGMTAICFTCRGKGEPKWKESHMTGVTLVTMNNGRKMAKGPCSRCGKNIFRFVKSA